MGIGVWSPRAAAQISLADEVSSDYNHGNYIDEVLARRERRVRMSWTGKLMGKGHE